MTPVTEEHAVFAREQLAGGCNRLEEMLHGLRSGDGPTSDQVHSIRKLGKSLRGGFVLFGLEKSSAMEIQSIGRLLSESRDAVSRLNTWRKLGWNQNESAASAILGMLEHSVHSATRQPPAEVIAWCLERVDLARRPLIDLAGVNQVDLIDHGLRKLRKRMVKRSKRLSRQRKDDFHEARKAAKSYLGALGFLPDPPGKSQPVLHDLAELLGDENDLATLSAWLLSHGFTKAFLPGMWQELNRSRRLLREKAMRHAAKLAG
jgi:hypothetical protein